MKNCFGKRLLSVLLLITMVAGLAVPMTAAGAEPVIKVTQVENSAVSADLQTQVTQEAPEEAEYAATDLVRVSIVLEEKATAELYSTENIARNTQAMAYRDSLRSRQETVASAIRKSLGGQLDVVWNLTLAANIISANVPYGKIETIEAAPGVKEVLIETLYAPGVVEQEEAVAQPNSGLSGTTLNSSIAWSAGYTGAGSRIAIIDTGTDAKHQSFDPLAYEYSLNHQAELLGVDPEEYVKSLDLLDAEEIAAVAGDLNVSVDPAQAYVNAKIPFGYNYVDKDYDIYHVNDKQGEHGSHVSGIAAANSWIPQEDGSYTQALSSVYVQGVAPDAQIISLKIFGKNGGAYESDYMAAIEDAVILGCDAVNLSLGTNSPGNSRNATEAYQAILENLENSGTVVTASMGNNYFWPLYMQHLYDSDTSASYLYADDVNMMTGGSPASNTNTMAVASMENDGTTNYFVKVNDEMFFYTDQPWMQDEFITLAGEQEYVFIDGYGYADEWEAVGDALEGKIAICSRGARPDEVHQFYQKAEAAVDAGAIGVIIYNNEPGVIYLDLLWYAYTQPCVSMTQADAAALRALSTPVTDEEGNVLYLTGTMTVSKGMGSKPSYSDYYTMSRFSSWGVPGSLELKPEITAPGGEILSVWGEITHNEGYSYGGYDKYMLNSGTSMAAPQVAGLAAVLAQYIRENDLAEKAGVDARTLAQSLMMSTATPMLQAEDAYYPVIRQGAGLANVGAATTADSFLLMDENATDSWADGKVKAELGDDPDRIGVYSFSFTINNLTEQDQHFELSADFFTQAVREAAVNDEGDLGLYMDQTTSMIGTDVAWEVDGQTVTPVYDLSGLDFNGDGAVNSDDGQALLDHATGLEVTLTNADKADLDADGDVDTYDAYLFLSRLNTGTACVPASGSAAVTVTVTLSDAAREAIDASFPKGTYVEGYVFAECVSSEEGVMGTSHSIPVLAFYGSWTDPSMYDVGTRMEYASGEEDRLPYTGYTETNAFTVVYDSKPNKEYWFGGNPVVPDEVYLPERNAINSENGDLIKQLAISPIRGSVETRYTVTDAAGEVISENYLGDIYGAYYDLTRGLVNTQVYLKTGFNPSGAAEGDRFELSLTMAPEYYRNDDGSIDWEALGEGASLTVPVVIDNTDPVMEDIMLDLRTGNLVVTASDNQYVAAVALYNSSGNSVVTAAGSKSDIQPGELAEYELDLSNVVGSRFLLQVQDYAMNTVTFALEMELGTLQPLPTFIASNLDREDYDVVRWTNFEKTSRGYEQLPFYAVTDETFIAATIADHIILAATDEGMLYATQDSDITNTVLVADLGTIVADMAYNAADGKVYAVDGNSNLLTIDGLTGAVEKVGTIGLTTNTLACDASGTFYCNEYNTKNVYSFTLDTMAAPTLLTSGLRYATQYLQSMEWNPNDGKIYYASFSERTSWGNVLTYAYFYEIDPTTGAVTRYNNMGHQLCALIIPEAEPGKSSWDTPTDAVSAVALSQEQLGLAKGGSFRLSAIVQPWTATDRTVIWTSSDESVATVNQKGDVTAVGEGTAVITAAASLDPSVSASCTVTVEVPTVTLEGLLQDEIGQAQHFTWNVETDGSWTGDVTLGFNMTSGTVDEATDTAYVMDSVYGTWNMHQVDLTTGKSDEVTLNPIGVPLWDMEYSDVFSAADAPRITAVYANYLLPPKDPMNLDASAFSLTDLFTKYTGASYLVAIASRGYEQLDNEGQLLDTEHLQLLDSEGYVWDYWIYEDEGNYSAMVGYAPTDLAVTFSGDSGMVNLYSSMVVGEDGKLYLSAYTGETNELFCLSYDEELNGYRSLRLGDAGDGVWPLILTGASSNEAAEDAAPTAVKIVETVAAEPIDAEALTAASRTAAYTGEAVRPSSDSQVEEGESFVTVTVTTDAASNNGLVKVTWDSAKLALDSAAVHAGYTAKMEAEDSLTFGYVALTEIPENCAVATLRFRVLTAEDSEITVEHQQVNNTAGGVQTVAVHFEHTNTETRDAVEATCTEDGYTGDVWCLDCGQQVGTGTVIPATGHSFGEWTVEQEATCTENGTEVRTCHCGETETREIPAWCASADFTDVPLDAWFHEAVDYVVDKGYMNGISETLFAPEGLANRAQLVTVLYRMAGSPETEVTEQFVDVPADAWFAEAVAWAYTEGITTGTTQTTFSPDAALNREQLATFLARYAAANGVDVTAEGDLSAYADADQISGYAVEAMAWAVENGIIVGMSDDLLQPTGTTNRAQLATVLMRLDALL